MNDKLVSVIIPVYNIRDYVGHCIKSVINQTYKALEIIVVDDGSTDGSSGVCDDIAKEDDRIKVIHRTNGGLSAARNSGIEASNGEYIVFLDGDDEISPDSISYLVNLFEQDENAICSVHSYCRITEYGHTFDVPNYEKKNYTSEEALKGLMTGSFIDISACGKLYPKELLGNLRFSEGRTHFEDKYFLFKYFLKNKGNVVLSNDKLYGYYIREGSITQSKYSDSILNILYFYNQMLKITWKYKPDYYELAEYNDLVGHLFVLKAIIRSGVYREQKKTFCKVKSDLLKRYGKKSLNFFKKYKYEIISMKISDYLYIFCVYCFDLIKGRRKKK